jgi:FHS family glucose/mannose:H+ symporter-like MFS transporter
MERAFNKRLLTGVACSGIFVFGIVMALLGSTLPLLARRISLSLGQMGNLFFIMNLAMMLVMPVLGPLLDHIGMRFLISGGSLLTAISLAWISGAWSYPTLLVAVFFLGAAGGCLNGTTNTLVADLNTDPRQKTSALNLLGVFFGFGALSLPFCIGALVERFGFRLIVLQGAVLTLVLACICFVPTYPPPKQEGRIQWNEVSLLARNPAVLLLGFLLFFQSGNEFIMGGYLAMFLNSQLDVPISRASFYLATYWGAIMLARLILSRLLLVMTGPKLVLNSALAAALGVTLLLLSSNTGVTLFAVLLIGTSFAGIFPTTLGVAGTLFPLNSGTVFGIMFTIALSGGMILPWIVGQLAAVQGLRRALVIVIFDALMILFLQLGIAGYLKTRTDA